MHKSVKADDLFIKKVNKRLYRACKNACRLLFYAKPVYKNENEEKMTKKCTDFMPGGLHEGYKIIREFSVMGKDDIFGAIVLPACVSLSDEITEFNIHFYQFKNHERPEMFRMVEFFTWEESEMIIHGKNPEEILCFRKKLKAEKRDKKYTLEARSSSNEEKSKNKLAVILGTVFLIAGTAFFLKEACFV